MTFCILPALCLDLFVHQANNTLLCGLGLDLFVHRTDNTLICMLGLDLSYLHGWNCYPTHPITPFFMDWPVNMLICMHGLKILYLRGWNCYPTQLYFYCQLIYALPLHPLAHHSKIPLPLSAYQFCWKLAIIRWTALSVIRALFKPQNFNLFYIDKNHVTHLIHLSTFSLVHQNFHQYLIEFAFIVFSFPSGWVLSTWLAPSWGWAACVPPRTRALARNWLGYRLGGDYVTEKRRDSETT